MNVMEKEFSYGCFQPSCDRPELRGGLILSDPSQFSTVSQGSTIEQIPQPPKQLMAGGCLLNLLHTIGQCSGWNNAPQRHVHLLNPITCGYDFIWKRGFCKSN